MRLHLLLVILFATCRGIRLTLEENQDLKKTCGAPYLGRARRSIGGVLSSMEQYPWIVAVYSKEGRQSSGCTGTLLSNRHVLTAAHCVVEMTETLILRCKSKLHSGELSKQPERDNNPTHTAADPAKFQIYVGNQCNNPLMCKAKHRLFTAKNISYHQLYDPCRDHSDIAIITLEETVSMDEAHPICLATEDLQPTVLSLTAVGYGKSPPYDIKAVNMLRGVVLQYWSENSHLKEIMTKTTNKSICQGDSGGPLVVSNKQGKSATIGISFGTLRSCSLPSLKGRINLFTDVRGYLQWICNLTGICSI
ncbi:hypothetical protein Q1695_014488 [Nippostrongylus brasiliensis]|nr:hypothetical protein Q1695_014488 [Nippostrongylus brasiliensis]